MFAPNALICTAFKHDKRFPRNITLLAAASDQSDLAYVWLIRIPTDCHTRTKSGRIHWDCHLVLGGPVLRNIGIHQVEPLLAHVAVGIAVVMHVAIFAEFIVLGLNLVIDAVFYLYAIHIFLSSFLLLALVNGRKPEGPRLWCYSEISGSSIKPRSFIAPRRILPRFIRCIPTFRRL